MSQKLKFPEVFLKAADLEVLEHAKELMATFGDEFLCNILIECNPGHQASDLRRRIGAAIGDDITLQGWLIARGYEMHDDHRERWVDHMIEEARWLKESKDHG